MKEEEEEEEEEKERIRCRPNEKQIKVSSKISAIE